MIKIISVLLLANALSLPLGTGESALPLLVEPPVSQGWNEGFSREPAPPVFHKKERILVVESISSTKRKHPKGNNIMFRISEYYISPDGRKMQITHRAVLEGSSKVVNEENFELTCLGTNVFRMGMGERAFCIYKAKFTADGDLESLMVFYYDGVTPAERMGYYLYSNKGLQHPEVEMRIRSYPDVPENGWYMLPFAEPEIHSKHSELDSPNAEERKQAQDYFRTLAEMKECNAWLRDVPAAEKETMAADMLKAFRKVFKAKGMDTTSPTFVADCAHHFNELDVEEVFHEVFSAYARSQTAEKAAFFERRGTQFVLQACCALYLVKYVEINLKRSEAERAEARNVVGYLCQRADGACGFIGGPLWDLGYMPKDARGGW